jgi:mono/diheme cytochrome c family protein
MKTSHFFPSLAAALATAWLLAACQSMKPLQDAAPATASADSASAEKSGTQLWAENCTRCHGNRSPAAYSDSQWAVAMMHMRVRANLTAEEHRKILEFLQSAN